MASKTSLKIGVLTFHRCINYGSYWQASCLVEALRARGHDAVLLDHYSQKVNLAEWTCALRPVLPTYVPTSDYPLYKEKIRKFYRAAEALPCSPCFSLDEPEGPDGMETYDLVVVGSDEVWNLRHPWYGGCSFFYGYGVRAERLVSYAASFGNYPASDGIGWWWADQLRRFDAISVRDDNSRQLISTATGREPQIVLDPCLQFVPQPLSAWQDKPWWAQEPYVAVYGHNFSPWFSQGVRRWAEEGGYRLVSIGYRNDWADEQWLSAGPNDFVHFMHGAQAVVTSFFHGCVFALRNEKPFACEYSDYRSIKIRNLMGQIGGEGHLVSMDTPAATYSTLLTEPVAPTILSKINSLRGASTAYLDGVL